MAYTPIYGTNKRNNMDKKASRLWQVVLFYQKCSFYNQLNQIMIDEAIAQGN